MRAFFAPPPYEKLQDLACREIGSVSSRRARPTMPGTLQHPRAQDAPGYRIVFVSLKKHGEAPGDITADRWTRWRCWPIAYSFGMVRTTHDQNLVLADVPQRALREVWQALERWGWQHPISARSPT